MERFPHASKIFAVRSGHLCFFAAMPACTAETKPTEKPSITEADPKDDNGNGNDTDSPPKTTILTGPASVESSNEATFTFACNEEACTFECRIDGGAW